MNVDELLEQKKIDYESKGKDYKVHCLNPEHDDNSPSMHIDKVTGIFNCFSCGYKGNIFSLLGEKANILEQRRQMLKRKINEKRAENIGLNIPSEAVPMSVEWRGISLETFQRFEAFQHHDNQFIGRVVFPIRNISGKIVSFVGRAQSPEKQPKYLNYPENAKLPLFPNSVKPYRGCVVLVEGIFDMLNLYDKGLENVVCAFGTKKVTKDKLQLLKVKGVQQLDIFFDGDEAGQSASEEIQILAKSLELTTRNIKLQDRDPGELTAQQVISLKEKLYG